MATDVRQAVQQFDGQTADQGASMLLNHFDGDRRKAEVEAWRLWGFCAGGEVGRRPRDKSAEAQYFVLLIRAIIDSTESPPVPRAPQSIKPAGAFAAPFLAQNAA